MKSCSFIRQVLPVYHLFLVPKRTTLTTKYQE